MKLTKALLAAAFLTTSLAAISQAPAGGTTGAPAGGGAAKSGAPAGGGTTGAPK